MEGRKTDRRILRTRRMIDEAMMALLAEKTINEISITALCERADINRNTFYCHYNSPMDVMQHLEEEMTGKISAALSASVYSGDATETVLAVLKEEKTLTTILLSDHVGSGYIEKVFSLADSHIHTIAARQSSTLSPEYLAMLSDFSIAGGAAVVKRWVENGMRERPEDIAKFIRILSRYGSNEMMNTPEPGFQSPAFP